MKQKEYKVLMYDDFNAEQLNTDYWHEFYLPQWSSRELSKPRYRIENSILKLYIADDQKPWCPQWNGDVKVSNLQTGVFSGPLHSSFGQHHFTKDLSVRQQQKKEIKVALEHGRVELKARANITKENVAALWLIGLEERAQESAEICLFELKGENVGSDQSIIGYGVHPFSDPTIKDCFYEEAFAIDTRAWNTYAFDWDASGIDFYINGKLIKRITETPKYKMQLMLNLYNLGGANDEKSVFEVDYVKVLQLL